MIESMPTHMSKCKSLTTEHLAKDLGRRTVKNTFVTAASQAVRLTITIVSTIVLSRLLSPKDFGIVAMVTAITGFLEVLKDAGLSTATIQREDITQSQVSNLFWINVGIGVLAALLIAALAPLLSWFYQEPRVYHVALFLSTSFLITAFSVQHQAVLRRQMRFKAIALIQIASALSGLVVAVMMALRGWGYWSLVASTIVNAGVNTWMTWALSAWRPSLPARDRNTIPLLRFGAHLTGAGLAQAIVTASDTILIGRFYGSEALGLYSRGATLLANPLQQAMSPLNAVVMPSLCRLQAEAERFRRAYIQMLSAISIVAMPLAGLLLGTAPLVVVVLLGEKWINVVPIFSAFTVTAIYGPLAGACIWLINSQGRGRDMLLASICSSFLSLTSIIMGMPYGPAGVALSYSISGLLVRLPLLFYFAGKTGPVRTGELWRNMMTHLPLGLAAYGTSKATALLMHDSVSVLQLVSATLVSAVTVLLIVVMRREYMHTLSIVRMHFRAK